MGHFKPDGSGLTTAVNAGGWKTSTLTAAAMSRANIVGRKRRVALATGAANGNSASIYSPASLCIDEAFRVKGDFAPFAAGTVGKRRILVGLSTAGVPAAAALATTPVMGFYADVADTTMKVRGATGALLDLGADFPVNSPDTWYSVVFQRQGPSGSILWQIENTTTGAVAAGEFGGVDITNPAVFHSVVCAVYTTTGAQSMFIGDWST
jgi:hypothetical protein